MLSIEERETIEYIKSRLYGNELRIFLNLVEKLQKDFTLKNHKICNLEFIIEKQIEEMKRHIDLDNECEIAYISKIKNLENNDKKWKDKIKARIEKLEDMYNGLPKNPKEHLHSKTEYKIVIGELQSLLEKE